MRAASGISADALPAAARRAAGRGGPPRRRGPDAARAEDAAAAPAPRPEEPAPDPDAEDADPVERDAGSLDDHPRRRLLRPAPIAAALAAVLLVAGLGIASASGLLTDDDSWRSQEPTSTPGPPSTPDPRIGMPVPAFTAEPPARLHEELTEAESARRLQDQADSSWESVRSLEPDLPRPEATLERVVEGAEWVRQQAACLQDQGVDVRVIGVDDDVRLSVHSAPSGIAYACQVRFPARPQGPPTAEALAYLHAYYVDFLLPCLASEGAAYDGDVPDLARFIARERAGDPWYPEASSSDGGIAFRCPQAPEALR
ncbi:hypothetical protein [Clavibacter zhangzhiyongii]|uniref:hypothetical protein n=1 Tax=Clavibacter zhangzhiyongii TaxID=2768071 RepID=UPI0039DFFD10